MNQSINQLPNFTFALPQHPAPDNAILTVELLHYAAYRVSQGAVFHTERALANYAAIWYAPPNLSTRCRCAPGRPVPPLIHRLRELATRSVPPDQSQNPAVVAERRLRRERAERPQPTAEQLHAADAWQAIADTLRAELPSGDFDKLVLPLQVSREGDRLVVWAPNRYVCDELRRTCGRRIDALAAAADYSEVDVRVGSTQPLAAARN